jgi:hypothetical protein
MLYLCIIRDSPMYGSTILNLHMLDVVASGILMSLSKHYLITSRDFWHIYDGGHEAKLLDHHCSYH